VSLLLDLPGLALVAGCLVLGLGLAAGGPPWLLAGERLVIGIVVAVVALTVVGYLLALLIGVTVGLVLVLAAIGWLSGGVLISRQLPRLRQDIGPASWRVLAAVALVALAMGYLFTRAVEVTPDAWLAHYNNTWSDWAFHASAATGRTCRRRIRCSQGHYSGIPSLPISPAPC